MISLRAVSILTSLCRHQSAVSKLPQKSNLLRGYVIHRRITAAVPTVPGLRYFTTGNDKSELVYHGSLSTRMKAVKVFSLTTSITGIAAQPIIYEQAGKLGGTPVIVLMCGFVGFFTFVTPFLLHFITKKYVTDITYDHSTQEYTATTISFLLTKIETKFKASDVRVPDVPGMFTSFVVGKTPLFVEPTMFMDPEHYVKIMGYDKPIDFKLGPSLEQSSATNIRDNKKS